MRRTRRAGGKRRGGGVVGGRGERRAKFADGNKDGFSARSSDEEAVRGGCVPDEGQRASEPAGRAWERAKRRNVRRRAWRMSRERGRKRETRTRAYLTSRGGDIGGGESEKGIGTGCERARENGRRVVRRMGMPIEWRGTGAEDRRREGDWGRAKSAALDRNTAVSCARATRTAWSARKRTRRPESRT